MAAGNATSTVYVGNLPAESTPDAVRDAFAQFGDITGVEFPEFRPRPRPRPVFCWVTFASPASAAQAVEGANGNQFGDRTMRVELQLNDDARAARRETRAAERQERRGARAPRAAAREGEEGGRRRRRRRRGPALMAAAPTNVFIGRLAPEDVNEESARDLCGKFGAVEEVVVARNSRFMFVRFATAAQAEACIAGLNGQDVNGRTATVEAVTREDEPEAAAPARAPRGDGERRRRAPRRRRPEPDTLFVGNITREVSRDDILDLFGADNIDRVTMRGRFAVVRFVSEEAAQAGLINNGSDIKGNAIRVEPMGTKEPAGATE